MMKNLVSTFLLLLLIVSMMLLMTMQVSTLIHALKLSSSLQPWVGIGDRLLHTFFSKTPMPLNQSSAIASGEWEVLNDGKCIPGLGIGYLKERVVAWYSVSRLFDLWVESFICSILLNTIHDVMP